MTSTEHWRGWNRRLVVVAMIARFATPAGGSLCNVPSPDHPTADAAVRDVACTTIHLAAGTYAENVTVQRGVAIEGAGSGLSIVAGALEVGGTTTVVGIARLTLDGSAEGVAGCWASLLAASSGAEIHSDDDVAVVNSGIASGPCRIFVDGFESAGALAWSARFP